MMNFEKMMSNFHNEYDMENIVTNERKGIQAVGYLTAIHDTFPEHQAEVEPLLIRMMLLIMVTAGEDISDIFN